MNSNLFRTLLAAGVVILPLIIQFFGCSTSLSGAVNCSGSWIPAAYLPYVMSGMTLFGLLIKTFGGSGSAIQNMVSPAAPVVPASEAKEGTVSPAMVNAGAGATVVVRK